MADPVPEPQPAPGDRAWLRIAVVWAARLGVAATFAVAAVPKAVDLVGLAEDIRNYQSFPEWSLFGLAAVVPMLELVGAAAVLCGRTRWVRAGALVLGVLTVAFIALIASVMVRGIDLDCGCFGTQTDAEAVGWPTLLRDVVLLGGIGVAMLSTRPRKNPA